MIDKSKQYGTKRLSLNRLASIFQKSLGMKSWTALNIAKDFVRKYGCNLGNICDVSASYSDDGDIIVQYTENGVSITSIL